MKETTDMDLTGHDKGDQARWVGPAKLEAEPQEAALLLCADAYGLVGPKRGIAEPSLSDLIPGLDADEAGTRRETESTIRRMGFKALPALFGCLDGPGTNAQIRDSLVRCGTHLVGDQLQTLAELSDFEGLHCSNLHLRSWESALQDTKRIVAALPKELRGNQAYHPLPENLRELEGVYAAGTFALAGELLFRNQPRKANALIAEAMSHGLTEEAIRRCHPVPLRQTLAMLESSDPVMRAMGSRLMPSMAIRYRDDVYRRSRDNPESFNGAIAELSELARQWQETGAPDAARIERQGTAGGEWSDTGKILQWICHQLKVDQAECIDAVNVAGIAEAIQLKDDELGQERILSALEFRAKNPGLLPDRHYDLLLAICSVHGYLNPDFMSKVRKMTDFTRSHFTEPEVDVMLGLMIRWCHFRDGSQQRNNFIRGAFNVAFGEELTSVEKLLPPP